MLLRNTQGISAREDAELFTSLGNQSHFAGTDLLVNPELLFDTRTPPEKVTRPSPEIKQQAAMWPPAKKLTK